MIADLNGLARIFCPCASGRIRGNPWTIFTLAFFSLTFIFGFARPAVSGSENDFYREIARKPVASNEDVVRAAARFRGYHGADDSIAEAAYLKNLGVRMPRVLLKYPKRPSTKGAAANVFLNAMGASADDRGLLGRLFKNSRRYAARDAMAQKLLPRDSVANEFLSGGELLAMLARANEQTENKQ